ncbi:MAG: hypothetical protein OXE78_02430 [Gammaproteobacteria bacterium]|nr:hypothetical protein [Gammaproteobacteria bacterium]
MISLIIDSTQNWSLEDGYRNIHASIGITLDSMFRNKIGDMAESLIKYRMIAWLKAKRIIPLDKPKSREYELPNDMLIRYRSEPDIEFTREGRRIATIEIKGGRDPAGALERLGAMTKSFAETSPGCVNFLVAGVITPEMQKRLDTMGNIKVYQMDQITQDKECWDEFMNEIFHHTIRII